MIVGQKFCLTWIYFVLMNKAQSLSSQCKSVQSSEVILKIYIFIYMYIAAG